MIRKYHYVRWRWDNPIEVDKLADELREKYMVEPIKDHGWDLELDYMNVSARRDKYMIKSDTLTVFLSIFRVVMVQKVTAPFTAKDLELRNQMMELFPKERPTFLPWQSSTEPVFEIIDE